MTFELKAVYRCRDGSDRSKTIKESGIYQGAQALHALAMQLMICFDDGEITYVLKDYRFTLSGVRSKKKVAAELQHFNLNYEIKP